MRKLLVSCVFVFVLFVPVSSFGMKFFDLSFNNPELPQMVSKVSASNPYAGAVIKVGIVVGVVAVNYIWTYSNLFGGGDDSFDKGLDVDSDRSHRERVLQEVTKKDGPRRIGGFFDGPKNDEEERLKKMSEEYWRERHGYGLSEEPERDRENLKNKNSRGVENYAGTVDIDKRNIPLEKSEIDGLVDDGYEGGLQSKKASFAGGIVRATGGAGENGGVTETGGTQGAQEDGSSDGDTVGTDGSESFKVTVYNKNELEKLYKDKSKTNIKLTLDYNVVEFGSEDESLRFINLLIKENRLTKLGFRYESAATDDCFDEILEIMVPGLAEGLKDNTSLKSLSLSVYYEGHWISDEAVIALSEMLKVNKVLLDLNLFGMKMSSEGKIALAEALEINKTLKKINLGYTVGEQDRQGVDSEEDDIVALAKALKINKSLETVILRDDWIGLSSNRGVLALIDAVEENKTLKLLDLSDNAIPVRWVIEIMAAVVKSNLILHGIDGESDIGFYYQDDSKDVDADGITITDVLDFPEEGLYRKNHKDVFDYCEAVYRKYLLPHLSMNALLEKHFSDYGERKIARAVLMKFLQDEKKTLKDFEENFLVEEIKRRLEIFDISSMYDMEDGIGVARDRLEKVEEFFWGVFKDKRYSGLLGSVALKIYLNYQVVADDVSLSEHSSAEELNGLENFKRSLRKRGLFYLVYAYGKGDYVHAIDDHKKHIMACLIENMPEFEGKGGLEDNEDKERLLKYFIETYKDLMGLFDDFYKKAFLEVFGVLVSLLEEKQIRIIEEFKEDRVNDKKELWIECDQKIKMIRGKIDNLRGQIEELKVEIEDKKNTSRNDVSLVQGLIENIQGRILEKRTLIKKLEDEDLVKAKAEIIPFKEEVAEAEEDLKRFTRFSRPSSKEELKIFIDSLNALIGELDESDKVRKVAEKLKELVCQEEIVNLYGSLAFESTGMFSLDV